MLRVRAEIRRLGVTPEELKKVPVEVGPRVGELRVIDSGLKPDDRVIVAGLLRAIPGQKVDPQLRTAAAPAASTGAK